MLDDASDLDLIITEYLSDSRSPDVGIEWDPSGRVTPKDTSDDTDPETYDGFGYIEIYNNGASDIDLYNVAIGVTQNYVTGGQNPWEATHLLNKKMSLKSGSIFDGITFANAEQKSSLTNNGDPEWCRNPNEAVLRPGQFAVIWFWNDYTNTVMQAFKTKGGESYGKPVKDETTNELVYHKGFRDWYGIDDDALVLAIYAGTDTAGGASMAATGGNRFPLTTGNPAVYALLDESKGAYDLGTPAWSEVGGYNEKVLSLWQWGEGGTIGIRKDEGRSTVFVPASCTPDLFNRLYEQALDDEDKESYVPATNYYEIGHVFGFKEMAVVAFSEKPTPGHMDDWQEAYIAPTKVDPTKYAGMTLDAWVEKVINDYITVTAPEPEEEQQKDEEKIDVIFKDRDTLGNQGQNQQKVDKDDNNGGNKVILIVIIVAAVVVLAGAAVVVILVIKKKNKPVAADDVAAEGEVEVIDDNKAE